MLCLMYEYLSPKLIVLEKEMGGREERKREERRG